MKARGRAISKAVDVAEAVKNRFFEKSEIKDIKISTEIIETERGETKVSAMEIVIGK
ncbi:MAG: hypothetical protein ACE5J3_09530 [Methanosarcinales archaeon]